MCIIEFSILLFFLSNWFLFYKTNLKKDYGSLTSNIPIRPTK